jgi:hypothetical protein
MEIQVKGLERTAWFQWLGSNFCGEYTLGDRRRCGSVLKTMNPKMG